MNYRHAFHAGNFADVVKHVALVAILQHLKKKDAPFAVIDTHAGHGLYDLKSDESARTGEAEDGIAKLANVEEGPPSLVAYLSLVRSLGDRLYPGSPLIAARLKRPADRLVAIEKHPDDQAALAHALRPFQKTRAASGDGYALLLSLLPPPERRGLVILDPSYESPDEFSDVLRALADAYRRFATGIYLVWFPEKSPSDADAFCGEALATGFGRLLRIDLEIPRAADTERMNAAGLLVVNAPFGFAEEMASTLAVLERAFSSSADLRAKSRVQTLAE
jgi:23S rRNA (adenine2030-N6)-methyltransferase